MKSYHHVLTIAGSDSGGGAGIQADLKTFSALGCFGTSAITAVTVQNTRGVFGIHSIPPAIVQEQITAVIDDIKPNAIKIGMIHTRELCTAVASALHGYSVPVIVDPVMVATSGDRLMEEATIECLQKKLFPLATLLTPNLQEAQLLAGINIETKADMRIAARKILADGCHAVLLKGGHLKSKKLADLYLDINNEEFFESDFIDTANTHGTGCTLSSAIAAYCSQGYPLRDAIRQAVRYVHEAIDHGKHIQTGSGHGPLNHFYNPKSLIVYEREG